jgi:hypothetical protein
MRRPLLKTGVVTVSVLRWNYQICTGSGRIDAMSLLWVVVVVLVVLWLLGYLAVDVGGSLIHLLLVIAVIILIYQLLVGRRSV